MNGVIVIDKPRDFTSFDVVAVMRKYTREKKIGHTGTLDPMATGVLPLLLGRAAKAADMLEDSTKAYVASFQLGIKTDTGDSTGNEIQSAGFAVTKDGLMKACTRFTGEIKQLPPMYSAVSVKGQRLYKLARKGIVVEREYRTVTIVQLAVAAFDGAAGTGTLQVECTKGTYIRTLIEDIAESLGTVATMTALRRTKACGFTEADCQTLEEVKALTEAGGIDRAIQPVDTLFKSSPAVTVSPAQARRFQNGGYLDLNRLHFQQPPAEGGRLRVYGPDSTFLGLGTADTGVKKLKLLKLFHIEAV